MSAVKHADLVVLLLALPVFLVAGFPMAGYLVGAVAYVLQKAIKEVAERRALEIASHSVGNRDRELSDSIADMRKVAGLTAGSMIGRGWLTALAIFGGWFAAGQEDGVGLAAALLVVVCFTVYFSTAMVARPFTNQTTQVPS
ncbi:MAG: hypothetical protein JWO90_2934 [Solirubrobacterales bacterium]|jgi:hypothetical protein|nr:hypothetical protein [Solirubrobacterales bacterium]